MKVVFDIDGVLRNLSGKLNEWYGFPKDPPDWDYRDENTNSTVKDLLKKDPSVFAEAEMTWFADILISKFDDIECWTVQEEEWIKYTDMWLKKHMWKPFKVKYFPHFVDKYKAIEDLDGYIFDDYPRFEHYEKVIIPTYNYNKDVICDRRFDDKLSLLYEIKKIKSEKSKYD